MALDNTRPFTDAEAISRDNAVGRRDVDHWAASSRQSVLALLGLHASQPPNPKGHNSHVAAVIRSFAVAGVHRQFCQSELEDTASVVSHPRDSASALQEGSADAARACAVPRGVRFPSDIREAKGHGMTDNILIAGSPAPSEDARPVGRDACFVATQVQTFHHSA